MTETYNQDEVKELFDVVFKLSAKDIDEKLKKVNNRPEIAKRRWFWELLQNAKDAVKPNEKVSVKLVLDKKNEQPFASFIHNGNPFRYQDAKNLIFPYSDKGDEKDSDKSGRFGTGFLATHILSKQIEVNGIYTKEDQAFDFKFTLDRSGVDKPQIAESINKTWQEFRSKARELSDYTYSQENFETSFRYNLTDESLQIVLNSLVDFGSSLPYALTFISKIESVEIKNLIDNSHIKYSKKEEIEITRNIKKHFIEKSLTKDGKTDTEVINIIVCSHESIDVAIEVFEMAGNIFIKEFPEHQPVLFCPFPLIGAKDFKFPTIINSISFVPKEERDGIWLDSAGYGLSNQILFETVIVPYFNLLVYAGEKNWKNRHLLIKSLNENVSMADFNEKWFNEKMQQPLKNLILEAPLMIDVLDGKRLKVSQVYYQNETSEENREGLWYFMKAFYPNEVPLKEEIHMWHAVLWKECPNHTIETFTKFVSSFNSVEGLHSRLGKTREDVLKWLNILVSFVNKGSPILLTNIESQILPNQFGTFKRKEELYLDDGSIDDELKEILADISRVNKKVYDWRTDLLEKKIHLELPSTRVRGLALIGPTISDIVKELLKEESPPNELRDVFSRLLNWLNDNPKSGREYFKGLRTETLLYKTANESKIRHITDLLQKDRDGEISVEQLANISASKIALLQDPNLELKIQLGEQVLEEQKREQAELLFKKKAGDIFESLFYELINKESKFDIKKVEGEEDFIIKNIANETQFYIELKSIGIGETQIQMTHKQAKKAHSCSDYYFLCVIPNNGGVIDQSYFLAHAKFDSTIGTKLTKKVNAALDFETSDNGIDVLFEDDLLKSYSKYRYKFGIHSNLWGTDNFNSFRLRLE